VTCSDPRNQTSIYSTIMIYPIITFLLAAAVAAIAFMANGTQI
jgi:hypothetical protein